MDFGRIINKHSVQFAYPTQVKSRNSSFALSTSLHQYTNVLLPVSTSEGMQCSIARNWPRTQHQCAALTLAACMAGSVLVHPRAHRCPARAVPQEQVCVPVLQVTHMPHLEEAIMQSVQNGSGGGPQSEEGASHGSNGAARPPSPPRPTSSSATRAAQLEIEHSSDGSPPRASSGPGLAGSAAQAFGNEAHKSTDAL